MLAVGTLEPRKNLPRIAEAARRAGVELRVVGDPGWGGVELPRDGVRWLGFVPDAELARLLPRRALPRLPVALRGLRDPDPRGDGERHAGRHDRRGGAFEEVAGDAAVLVDPLDPAAIAAGIEEAAARAGELRALGLERAQRFTLGGRRRGDRRGLPRGGGVRLVVLDADVLGRRRTGDETYVANCCARCPGPRRRPGCASPR